MKTNFFRAGFMSALGASLALTVVMPVMIATTGFLGISLLSQVGKNQRESQMETQPQPQEYFEGEPTEGNYGF